MKKFFGAVSILLVVLFIPSWVIAETKPFAKAEISIQSLSYSRGEASSRDSMIITPSFTVGCGDFSFNLEALADSAPYISGASASEAMKLKEPSLTLAYGKQFDIVAVELAGSYLGSDGDKDKREVSLSLGFDVPLAPTLVVAQTIGTKPVTYLSLGLSHAISITEAVNLNLEATAGYLVSQTQKSEEYSALYFRTKNDGSLSDEKYAGLLDGVVTASLSFELGNGKSVEPFLSYAFPLSQDAKNFFRANSPQGFAGGSDSYLFGGVKFALSF